MPEASAIGLLYVEPAGTCVRYQSRISAPVH